MCLIIWYKGVDSKNKNGEWIILVVYVIEINDSFFRFLIIIYLWSVRVVFDLDSGIVMEKGGCGI